MLENKYNPKDFEDKLYEEWEKKGYFKPSSNWKITHGTCLRWYNSRYIN